MKDGCQGALHVGMIGLDAQLLRRASDLQSRRSRRDRRTICPLRADRNRIGPAGQGDAEQRKRGSGQSPSVIGAQEVHDSLPPKEYVSGCLRQQGSDHVTVYQNGLSDAGGIFVVTAPPSVWRRAEEVKPRSSS